MTSTQVLLSNGLVRFTDNDRVSEFEILANGDLVRVFGPPLRSDREEDAVRAAFSAQPGNTVQGG